MKQQSKFPFSTAGVARWQEWLSGLSPLRRNEEAVLVEQGLHTFMPGRFELAPEQVAFLDSLSPELCALWAAQLAYAIRLQVAIELIKPAQPSAEEDRDGVKFIESECGTCSTPDETDRPLAGLGAGMERLHFTISY